ncbi:MAG TPA: hypothetical protein VFA21_12745 [Pyrinomonadaceae bacterium]|jgi:hypothetical protein|nr:hypothetical protein [Pyrinomonadaceae bacterium]
MSKTLTFQIPDEIYKILEQQAEREGRKVESVALEWLNSVRPAPRPKLTDTSSRKASHACSGRKAPDEVKAY